MPLFFFQNAKNKTGPHRSFTQRKIKQGMRWRSVALLYRLQKQKQYAGCIVSAQNFPRRRTSLFLQQAVQLIHEAVQILKLTVD